MAVLVFDCLDLLPDRYAASPTLLAKLRISETTGARIHAIALRCQLRIEPQKRTYTDVEKQKLYDIFGEPEQWGETLSPMQFANLSHSVQGFSGHTETDVPILCSYDLEISIGRYFEALEGGEVPFLFLFSGTVFVKSEKGFHVEQIPWDKETSFRFPAARWGELMDLYFPGDGWLRLNRGTIDSLRKFKNSRALPTWDSTMEMLLKEVEQ